MPTVIIHGPPKCGKTRHAKAFADLFGCEVIVDGWTRLDPLKANGLHLTSAEPPFTDWRGCAVMSFEYAHDQYLANLSGPKVDLARPDPEPVREIFRRDALSNDPFAGIGLGDEVADVLTGFQGVVMARIEYLTGCAQVSVLPRSESKSELKVAEWFDIERIELVAAGVVRSSSRLNGADIAPPAPRKGPR